MTDDRQILADHIQTIEPFDEIERDCQSRALDWIANTQLIYRLQKPDVPRKHVVAYFVAIDPTTHHILLVHHNMAQAWLPTGGHIEPQESPLATINRECDEELGVEAKLLNQGAPMFISEAQVVDGDHTHTDLSVWYMIELSESAPLSWERQSFSDIKWWDIDALSQEPQDVLGPDLHRFIRKLRYLLHQGHIVN